MRGLVGVARGTRWGAAVAVACVLLAGCGSQTVQGSPIAATISGQPAFDPCLLPDEVLVGVAVDPATKDPDFFGVRFEGWNACSWTADWYFLSIAATLHSVDEVRANPRNFGFTPVVVGNRDAFSYRETNGGPGRVMCDVAFRTTDGTIMIRVEGKWSREAPEDPCVVAVRSANALDPFLPNPR